MIDPSQLPHRTNLNLVTIVPVFAGSRPTVLRNLSEVAAWRRFQFIPTADAGARPITGLPGVEPGNYDSRKEASDIAPSRQLASQSDHELRDALINGFNLQPDHPDQGPTPTILDTERSYTRTELQTVSGPRPAPRLHGENAVPMAGTGDVQSRRARLALEPRKRFDQFQRVAPRVRPYSVQPGYLRLAIPMSRGAPEETVEEHG